MQQIFSQHATKKDLLAKRPPVHDDLGRWTSPPHLGDLLKPKGLWPKRSPLTCVFAVQHTAGPRRNHNSLAVTEMGIGLSIVCIST